MTTKRVSIEELTGRAEQFKSLTDHIKHIATLSSGTILILFTFLQNFIRQPTARPLVAASVLSLLFSIVAGTFLFGLLSLRFPRRAADPLSETERSVVAGALLLAWLGFLAGILFLVIFFLLNW